MTEAVAMLGAVVAFAVILLTPVAAFVAVARSRRIRPLEGRIAGLDDRVRRLEAAMSLDAQRVEPRAVAGATPVSRSPALALAARLDAEDRETVEDRGRFDHGAVLQDRFPAESAGFHPQAARIEPAAAHDGPLRPEPGDGSHKPSARPPVGRRAPGLAWEERIGANWLNKAGALLVVIGVSLFVGWSMVRLGPAGRVAIGLAVGGSLLAGGIAFERNPAFRLFAAGLVAAGWGGIYVTTYAMHGLEAARVIEDPMAAIGLLLAVAAGMIVHALLERSPAMVAVAYASAFGAVALGPASVFAVAACLVLAVTLLIVAYHHDWPVLALGGLVCTYAAVVFRFPPVENGSEGTAVAGHALIWACWAAFEVFDILMFRRGRFRVDASPALLPSNLCGLLGTAMLQWPAGWSRFDLFLAAAAVAYGVSTLCRAFVGRRSPLAAATPVDRLVLGGHESTITIAAALWAWAVWTHFETGWRLHAALLMEAELLFLAGIATGQRHLRAVAGCLFAVLLARFMLVDVPPGGTIDFGGLTFARWTPSALAAAAVLVANRALLAARGRQPLLVVEQSYSFAATALVAFVLGQEAWQGHNGLGPEHIGILWLVEAWVLLQVAAGFRLSDAYGQSGLVGLAAVATLGMVNAFPASTIEPAGDMTRFWIWLLPAAAILYAAGWQTSRGIIVPRAEGDQSDVGTISLLAASAGLVAFLWHALPAPLVALGWAGFALCAFQVGLRWPRADLRWHAYVAAGLATGRLFLANFTNAGMTGVVSHRLLTVVPVILLLYEFAARLSSDRLRRLVEPKERAVGRVFLWGGTLVLVVLLRFELGRVLAVLGWAAVGLVLLVLATRLGNAGLRWQSHAIALLTFARSWGTHFHVPESPDGLMRPWVLGGLVVASLFASEWISPPDAATDARIPAGPGRLLAWIDDHRRTFYAILATALLAVLLVHEMPASLLTAAVGIEGGMLLAVGFLRPDRSLRLCGLVVLGICLPKLFLYDLRQFDTPYRILSFLLLGMLLLAASWFYTRFKSRLQGLL